jgi:hypothetical protein
MIVQIMNLLNVGWPERLHGIRAFLEIDQLWKSLQELL